MAKQVVFNKCIGKKAHDGMHYHYSYTEWDFFRHAEFKLLNDGRMSVNVDQNLGYLTHYAPGKRNHGIFKDEMIFLAKIIGLEFDPSTDFEKEIIFTHACSSELKNIGLHLNLNYVMKLLQQKNHFSLFRQAYAFYGEDGNEFSNKLPVEIGEMIFKELAGPGLDNDDVREVYNQAWSNRL